MNAPVGEMRCLKGVGEAYNKHSHFGGVLAHTAPIQIMHGTNGAQWSVKTQNMKVIPCVINKPQ